MRRFLAILLIIVLGLGSYSAWALSRPLPELAPHSVVSALPAGSTPSLSWPGYGSAAVGAVGYGLLANHGTQTPLPTASVAKIMTALAVLQKKPLAVGQQGPSLTIGAADIAFYNDYVAVGGSVVPVNYGEQLSEYQALQALLLPSGNNIAESLALWAFGSVSGYTDYANTYAKKLGLNHSHFADASGFHAATVSTASDMVVLGTAALKNPVLAQIVAQPSADLPVVGTVENVNTQLGQDGINGIKTGNTDEAGGVYLASATYTVAGHAVTIVTAVAGAPALDNAMQDSIPLLASAQKGFSETTLVHKGDIVGYYNTPWHTSANAIATADYTIFGWKASQTQPVLSLRKLQVPASHGQIVGSLALSGSRSSPVILQQAVTSPNLQWRWLHP